MIFQKFNLCSISELRDADQRDRLDRAAHRRVRLAGERPLPALSQGGKQPPLETRLV